MKRLYEKTPSEDMVDVDTVYLRNIIHECGVNQSEMSIALGFCPEYLSNSIGDGRMNKEILRLLSDMLDFPYEEALAKKKKTKKHKKRKK